MNDALTTALQPVLAEARKRMAEGMAALRAEYEARPLTAIPAPRRNARTRSTTPPPAPSAG